MFSGERVHPLAAILWTTHQQQMEETDVEGWVEVAQPIQKVSRAHREIIFFNEFYFYRNLSKDFFPTFLGAYYLKWST